MHGLCREGKNHQGVTDKTAQARIMRAMPHRWKPNVTVAAIVEHEGRFLLVEEETADGLRLNNPAGHLDPGESPVDACIREVLEETAYDFEPEALVGMYLNRFTRTLDEIRACRERHRSPLLLQCLEDYLAGRRAPLELIHADPSILSVPAHAHSRAPR